MALMGSFARAAAPQEPDIVIVGAGAAGLAAARSVQAAGLSFVVLDAANRIGGRAHTDRDSLGYAWDRGCQWLHAGPRNAFYDFAVAQGFTLSDFDAAMRVQVYDGQTRLDAGAAKALDDQIARYEQAIGRVAEAGNDVSAADAIARETDGVATPWSATAEMLSGSAMMGAEFDAFSARDWYGLDSTEPNYAVAEGYGAVVERFGAGLPVRLSTPVQRVDWSGKGVAVDTPGGRITARAAIITVSVGVLKSGRIAFSPELPDAVATALDGLDMGILMKVALRVDPARAMAFDDADPNTAVVQRLSDLQGGYFLLKPNGTALALYFYGGRFGASLGARPEKEIIAFARERLGAVLGSRAAEAVTAGAATDWVTNANALGSYSIARPGQARARRALEAPLGERVWFAGEALGGGKAQNADGARLSGENAAAAAIRALGR